MAKVIEKGFAHLGYTIGKEDESDFTDEELDTFNMKLVELCESLGIQICGSLSPVVNETEPEWYDDDYERDVDDDRRDTRYLYEYADTENEIAEREEYNGN